MGFTYLAAKGHLGSDSGHHYHAIGYVVQPFQERETK